MNNLILFVLDDYNNLKREIYTRVRNYSYEQVVALAKLETAKNGGNALALTDHRKPSLLGSSCHQIAGDMLWIGDTANWEMGIGSDLSAPVGDKNTTGVVKSDFQHSTFYVNVGYAFITSKFYLPRVRRVILKTVWIGN